MVLLNGNTVYSPLKELVKMPDFSVSLDREQDKNTLQELNNRVISLSMTDNRGFEADRVTLVLDDADGQLALPGRGTHIRVM
ncbi:phage late control D family protein, partial [Escherichia coli]|nr:phage late control D family protein [Escherichia coli]